MTSLQQLLLVLMASLLVMQPKTESALNNSINFSRDNFFVKFNPPPFPGSRLKQYSEDELVDIYGKISERFSNFFNFIPCDDSLSTHRMTVAAAKFNKNELSSDDPRKISFLQVAQFNKLRDPKCIIKSKFDIAISLAREANKISPRTVEYIVLSDIMAAEEINREYHTRIAKRQLTEENGLKLGAIGGLSLCTDQVWFQSRVVPVLPFLDIFVFFQHPQRKECRDGPEESAKAYFKLFQKCKEKFRNVDESIELAFATSWSSYDFEGKEDLENQTVFWKEMNDWASSNNTKIFLDETFDNIYAESDRMASKGWWQKVGITENGNGYIFEEKEKLLKRLPQVSNDLINRIEKDSSSSNYQYVWISIGACAGLLLIFVFAGFLAYFLTNKRKQQLLSNKEIKIFKKDLNNSNPNDMKSKFPVDKICHGSFKIEKDAYLGSGEFGLVCPGIIFKDKEEVKVAVKMTKEPCTVAVLRSLLAELKTLVGLGRHPNVVKLIGTCTSDLKKNNLFIFLELCESGTLEGHLRSNINGINEHLVKNLIRWSLEISYGMEYVASKKIVHMDIATRNVLLTSDFTAKIADFGLSRRLYNYQEYRKKNQEPLPWRWLSPESLDRAQFNEKSDVWAFGVTLWEIFSLGGLPYAGIQWDVNFGSVLVEGLRLNVPQVNPKDIYSEVIKTCWKLNPDERPSFSELKLKLEKFAELNFNSLDNPEFTNNGYVKYSNHLT